MELSRPSSSESIHFDPSKCVRQPRSNLARRPSRRGFFTVISCLEEPSVKLNESCPRSPSVIKGMDIPMARCYMSSLETSISNSAEVEHAESELVDRNTPADSFVKGSFKQHHSNCARSLFPEKPLSLEINGCKGSWLTPGSVVWAKVDSGSWWPAQIMDRKAALQLATNQSNDRLVPVRLCGSCEYAWVDPICGLSHFKCCYEERSNNPLKPFQDALRQALHTKEDTSPSEYSDKCDVSSSSLITGDHVYGGRGKRKRKPKAHFDELATPEKSIRKLRRMRIMRLLGLTAPVGSPFTQPRGRHT